MSARLATSSCASGTCSVLSILDCLLAPQTESLAAWYATCLTPIRPRCTCQSLMGPPRLHLYRVRRGRSGGQVPCQWRTPSAAQHGVRLWTSGRATYPKEPHVRAPRPESAARCFWPRNADFMCNGFNGLCTCLPYNEHK